eukprot:4695756-Lingulodinium_polyedra.AAC.1
MGGLRGPAPSRCFQPWTTYVAPFAAPEAAGVPACLPCRRSFTGRCALGCGEPCRHGRWRQVDGRAEC